jgi:hypothetical protein
MNIQDFGKIYAYLFNAPLRIKETGKERIVIKGASFPGEVFRDTSWGTLTLSTVISTVVTPSSLTG